MGWSYRYSWRTLADVHNYVTRPRENGTKVVAKCAKDYGRRLWTVFERPDGVRFICLFLCNRHKDDGLWTAGYKDITEDIGPSEVDCPLSYLTLAPYREECGRYSKDWREKVRAYHAEQATARKRMWVIGDECMVYGHRYSIVGTIKKSFIIVGDRGRFRCGPSKMQPIVQQA